MVREFPCPSCGAEAWKSCATCAYELAGGSGSADPGRQWADRFQRQFFFEKWAPGERVVELRELLCRRCGVLTYSPRPTEEDLRQKYLTLGELGLIAVKAEPDTRAAQVATALRPFLTGDAPSALDVGGGDGSLLTRLAQDGVRCHVVDYATDTVEGVERVGETLADVPAGARFDAIVLSHVLEHLPSPRETVARVRELLAPGGVILAEVPVEIWRGTPVAIDPVTHVNHFVGASLRTVFRLAGLRILRAFDGWSHYNGFPLEVARVIATEGPDPVTEDPVAAVERRLRPSLISRSRRRAAVARGRRRPQILR